MNKMIVLAAVLAACVTAKADETTYQYLYWQVQPDQVADDVEPYNAAFFYVLDGDNVRTVNSFAEWNKLQEADSRTASEPVGTSNGFSSYATGDYSFLWELAYWDGSTSTAVGRSDTYTYDQLKSLLTSVKGGSNIPTQSVLSPSFIAIPEPTSGLLMLFGIAGLAIRRKRM